MKSFRFLFVLCAALLMTPELLGESEPAAAPASTTETARIFTRQWKVSSDFFGVDGGADAALTLKELGILFPAGASAEYNNRQECLLVRNTPDNLNAVDKIIKEYKQQSNSQNGSGNGTTTATQNTLLKRTWKVPRAFIKDRVDGADFLLADAQYFLDVHRGIIFTEVEGACACYRNGRLTIVHSEAWMRNIQRYLDLGMEKEYIFKPLGEAEEVTLEEARKLKPKKHKKKATSWDGEVLNIEAYYRDEVGEKP